MYAQSGEDEDVDVVCVDHFAGAGIWALDFGQVIKFGN